MAAEFLLQHAEPLLFTCMSIVRQYTVAEMAVYYYADRQLEARGGTQIGNILRAFLPR